LSLKAQFLILSGVVLLTFSIMILFAPANLTNYVIIDVALHTTPYRLVGKTHYDFNNVSSIEMLPKNINGWTGSDFRYPERVYRILQAKIILSREYTKNGNIIWLDIINSDRRKSFHDPRICFSVNWNIVKEGIVSVPVNVGVKNIYVDYLYLSNKKNPDLKLVSIYWYMLRGSEGITMFRVNGFVNKNYNSTLETLKIFTSDVLGLVYTNVKSSKPLIYNLLNSGLGGIAGVIAAFAIPFAIIGYGSLELIRSSRK